MKMKKEVGKYVESSTTYGKEKNVMCKKLFSLLWSEFKTKVEMKRMEGSKQNNIKYNLLWKERCLWEVESYFPPLC